VQPIQSVSEISNIYFLNILEFTELTVYYSLIYITQCVSEDTVIVSDAAEATDSIII